MRVRRQSAKKEVKLLEKGSRRRRAGWWGGTGSRACRSCASIVARIRTLAQHQRNAILPAGVGARDACKDGICMPVPANERISRSAGRGPRRTGHARMEHHGLWRGRGWGGRSQYGWVSGLRDKKMTWCNASPALPSMRLWIREKRHPWPWTASEMSLIGRDPQISDLPVVQDDTLSRSTTNHPWLTGLDSETSLQLHPRTNCKAWVLGREFKNPVRADAWQVYGTCQDRLRWLSAPQSDVGLRTSTTRCNVLSTLLSTTSMSDHPKQRKPNWLKDRWHKGRHPVQLRVSLLVRVPAIADCFNLVLPPHPESASRGVDKGADSLTEGDTAKTGATRVLGYLGSVWNPVGYRAGGRRAASGKGSGSACN
ncbi:hypothetical protein B0H13DRAFT_2563136 [Mycena leptocephala]|nr:hypothetical protein B0H13DRAFT_2563136 [Mycena leptocephala]